MRLEEASKAIQTRTYSSRLWSQAYSLNTQSGRPRVQDAVPIKRKRRFDSFPDYLRPQASGLRLQE